MVDFKTLRMLCKFAQAGYDPKEGDWAIRCTWKASIPKGCSWGKCDDETCKFYSKEGDDE